ncbi:MAG: hypothetical protein DRH17_01035 [Deltaproteobacteria bacterium]|nr:MAG: hypothetical protein DRH17_01035 [Deltaproteobacteria bacterium]
MPLPLRHDSISLPFLSFLNHVPILVQLMHVMHEDHYASEGDKPEQHTIVVMTPLVARCEKGTKDSGPFSR